nr:hypothetical protein [Tanacetum cinerariifolium]
MFDMKARYGVKTLEIHGGEWWFMVAQLVDTDSESDPEEAPLEAEESQPLGSRVPLTDEEFEASESSGIMNDSSHSLASSDSTIPLLPDHPLTQVSPTPTPTRALFHRKTVHITVRTQSAMSHGLSARVTEAMALLDSAFRKRLDDEGHGLDDEGHNLDDKGHGLDDEDHGLNDECLGLEDEGLGLEEEEGAKRLSAFRQPTLDTWADPEDGMIYTNILAYVPLAVPVQTSPSLKWSLGSLQVSTSSHVVPSPIASPMATLTSTILVDEDQFIEVGAQLELHESILHDQTQHLDVLL